MLMLGGLGHRTVKADALTIQEKENNDLNRIVPIQALHKVIKRFSMSC